MSNNTKLGLEDAYAVKTPDDNRLLYRAWADTYDESFARARGYQYPQKIAAIYAARAGHDDTPILDIGSGTGLVAEALHQLSGCSGDLVLDGIDISPEMLQASSRKNIYRQLFEADLTQPVPLPDEQYGAAVSAGTFTHGHVGPDALTEILRLCRSGALLVIGVNGTAFDQYKFGSAFATLQADNRITPIEYERVRYYAKADDPNADDQGYAAVFRKT